MKILIFLIFIFPIFSLQAHYHDSFSLEGDFEYLCQKSTPSETKTSGFVGGIRYIHQHRFERFGYTDRLYAAWGLLTGEDLFDDDVRVHYMELDGEFWLNLFFSCKNVEITPFIGYGIRQHLFRKTRPFDLFQEFNYLYIPMGFTLDYDFNAKLSFGTQFKLDMMTYTLWRYLHPVIEASYYDLEKTPSYEAKIWMIYRPSCNLSFNLTPSFRYVTLCFPDQILFAPESKQLYYFGVRLGATYSY